MIATAISYGLAGIISGFCLGSFAGFHVGWNKCEEVLAKPIHDALVLVKDLLYTLKDGG